ncbi:hypothetical protein H7F51_11565 [Novosphingobium flavum]|uniref:DUF429 domain-containing protein n=1 Tax=Novosphingobium flavum TaxID=1778672 RepID=A0A7X1FSG1_9SPHN|nr:hypothetical protein [Novosphingobium flavum]
MAIDWSGAAGERHRGIALAMAQPGDGAPELVRPGHRWSRGEVLDWLLDELPADSLVGLDLGMSLPFADAGAFFPGWIESPADARALWALVDRICADDPHLGVSSFVDHPEASAYFRRHGGREGAGFGANGKPGGRGRFRRTEHAQERMGCRPYSNFNLIGAAQVGKGSLSGMRVLHRLGGALPVWPVDPLPAAGSVVVEIYTSLAAIAAGRSAGRSKMRDHAALNAALAVLGSMPVAAGGPIDDHRSDALLTAAWLRRAASSPQLWMPAGLAEIAQTEGWTFGAT